MITVANRIYVNPEYADAFETAFRERAGLVDGMPGFLSNQVLRPVNEGDPYVVLTQWESRETFLNWVRSEAFQKGHAQSGTLPPRGLPQAECLRNARSHSGLHPPRPAPRAKRRPVQDALAQQSRSTQVQARRPGGLADAVRPGGGDALGTGTFSQQRTEGSRRGGVPPPSSPVPPLLGARGSLLIPP